MRFLTILILSSAPFAQQLHVTASPLLPNTIKAMFGKNLPKGYSAVQVDVCSDALASLSAPLGAIRQKFRVQFPKAPVTILSNSVASQVIAANQGNSKTAIATRIIFAVAGAASVGAGFSGISAVAKTALTDFAIDGPLVWSLFSAVGTPAALISYTAQAVPETLKIAPADCLPSAVQLIEGLAAPVTFDVTLPVKTGETK